MAEIHEAGEAADAGAKTASAAHCLSAWQRKTAVLIVATIAALLLAEWGIRLVFPGFPSYQMPQVEHRPQAEFGYDMIPGQQAYTLAEPVSINSQGYRGPEVRAEQSPSDLRVLCLGDSFTFGFGVRGEAAYARKLEKLIEDHFPKQNCEVINAGVQGYATFQEIDFLNQRGLALDPDIVTLAVYFNDLVVRPNGSYVEMFKQRQLEEAQTFRKRHPNFYLFCRQSALLTRLSSIFSPRTYDSSLQAIMHGEETEDTRKRWASVRAELGAFAELGRKHGFSPLVIAIPTRQQVVQRVVRDQRASHYPRRIHEYCEDLDIPSIDVVSTLREAHARNDDPYLRWDHHLSPTGHELVARALFDALVPKIADTKP